MPFVSVTMPRVMAARGMLYVAFFCGLLGCDDADNNRQGQVSVPVPSALFDGDIGEQFTVTARIKIPQLGIDTTLGVEGDRADGAFPELPPGQYTVSVTFETDVPHVGIVVLAEASRDIDITPGANTLTFYKSDYRYPDDDGDKYNNLVEVRFETNPSNGTSKPQTARVFITSVEGTANLSSWPDAGGETGLAAGDAICQTRADAAGLGGQFVAWLSDRNNDAYCRVHGLGGKVGDDCGQDTLPASAGPWVRVDGYPFASDIVELTRDSVIYTPLLLNEFEYDILRDEAALGKSINIWTGTHAWGTWAESAARQLPEPYQNVSWGDCDGWNSDNVDLPGVAKGAVWFTHQGWTDDGGAIIDNGLKGKSCSETGGLACFELGEGVPLPDFAERGKRVFMTSVFGFGDLSSWPDAGGEQGISAGDAICRARAGDANLPNAEKFKVFLSDDTINAIDRLVSDGPWVRVDGVPVAETKEDLLLDVSTWPIEGGTFASISVDEKGEYLTADPDFISVWTGTHSTLQPASDNCLNWTSSDRETYGEFVSAWWSVQWLAPPDPDSEKFRCDLPARLYCFEDE